MKRMLAPCWAVFERACALIASLMDCADTRSKVFIVRLLISRLAAGRLHRGENVRVRAAAADVAAHRFAYFSGVRTPRLFQHCDSGHDLTGRAVPALKTVMLDEGCLHRMQCLGLAEPFDRGDLRFLMHGREGEAAVHSTGIDVHGACAALTVIAALLRPGEMQRFAKRVEQRRPRIDSRRMRLSVDLQCHRNRVWSFCGLRVGTQIRRLRTERCCDAETCNTGVRKELTTIQSIENQAGLIIRS